MERCILPSFGDPHLVALSGVMASVLPPREERRAFLPLVSALLGVTTTARATPTPSMVDFYYSVDTDVTTTVSSSRAIAVPSACF